MTRRIAHLLVALQALASSAEPAASQQPTRIEFAAAPFDVPAALRDTIRFGWLTVPQDHDDAAAGTIRLALAIISARTAQPEPDPIVLLPGGPGGGHVTATVNVAQSPRVGLHRRSRAVIVLDPRGHGLSEPRTCPELNGTQPLTEEDTAGIARLIRGLASCRSRLAAEGSRTDLLNAVQTARDIEVLRRALDVPQLNLIGGSYGTRLAAEAMREVPWAVRSVVMDGPVVPLPRGAILPPHEEDAGVLHVILRRCAEQAECRNAFPQLEADYDTVLARAAREPRVVHVPRTARTPAGSMRVSDATLREVLTELGFTPRLAAGAPLLIHTLASRGVASLDHAAPALVAELSSNVAVGTHHAFRCNDGLRTENVRLFEQLCEAWVGERVRETAAAPLPTHIPTLIVVGEFDPRTPPRNAALLARQLPRAQVALVPWQGHSRLPDCAFHIVDAFLTAPERAVDVACLDSVPPVRFATNVVHSRWFGRAVARAGTQPLRVAAPAGAALLLLLVPLVGLPVRAGRQLHRGVRDGVKPVDAAFWLAAVAGVTLLVGAAAAAWAGARQSVIVPAIGVPSDWRWLLLLPWLLLVLTLAALVLLPGLARTARTVRYLYWSGMAGAAVVLLMWALHSVP